MVTGRCFSDSEAGYRGLDRWSGASDSRAVETGVLVRTGQYVDDTRLLSVGTSVSRPPSADHALVMNEAGTALATLPICSENGYDTKPDAGFDRSTVRALRGNAD